MRSNSDAASPSAPRKATSSTDTAIASTQSPAVSGVMVRATSGLTSRPRRSATSASTPSSGHILPAGSRGTWLNGPDRVAPPDFQCRTSGPSSQPSAAATPSCTTYASTSLWTALTQSEARNGCARSGEPG